MKNSHLSYLGGDFQHFLFSPQALRKWSNLIFFRGAVQPPPSYVTKHPQKKNKSSRHRSILPQQQHNHRPQAALLELQGLARGQEPYAKPAWLVGWCENWFRFFPKQVYLWGSILGKNRLDTLVGALGLVGRGFGLAGRVGLGWAWGLAVQK